MDAYRSGDRFYVHLDLPGIDPESIEITCEQNVLTIQAGRRLHGPAEDQPVVTERPQRTFSRQLFLGESMDGDRMAADYEHGVLTLRIPIADKTKPRRIRVAGSRSGPKTIERTVERRE